MPVTNIFKDAYYSPEQISEIKKRYLVGTIFLTQADELGIDEKMDAILDLYLENTCDRELFGLSPIGDC